MGHIIDAKLYDLITLIGQYRALLGIVVKHTISGYKLRTGRDIANPLFTPYK